ncbi:MAG: FAD binding domain-containing protein [Propionicimonas sp.]
MPQLILNQTVTELPAEDVNLLGWLRDHGLTAAKPGCLGGDCGACQVLLGEIDNGTATPRYRSVNSCLLSTGLVADCHLITVEGLNGDRLTPVQQALVEAGAIQCGYCTPGLVVALTGALLGGDAPADALAGNLCRCTGYVGIRLACDRLASDFDRRARTLDEAAEQGLLPEAVARAGTGLRPLPLEPPLPPGEHGPIRLGGETDHTVRHPHARARYGPWLRLHRLPALRGISEHETGITIGSAVTVAELQASPLIADAWPDLPAFLDRFGSPAIRHLATVGGNLVNASPVADLAVVLLALRADLTIDGPAGRRDLPLAGFFHGYKHTDLGSDELLVSVRIPRNRARSSRLHAEKVSRRRHDDIASVCSTMVVTGGGRDGFGEVALSAGGVSPVPALLRGAASVLAGRPLTDAVVREALDRLVAEIAPIGDVRGSAGYKAALLRHLVLAHLAALQPGFDFWGYLR